MVAPRIMAVPEYVSSAGGEAVELAAMAGLELDPWQCLVIEHMLGERADGKWAAFETGICVSRQNGKGAIYEARQLAGLFLLGERLLIHSAHEFPTSLEAFRRLLFLIENTPDLSRRVKRVSRSHGEEGIELVSGQRIWFRTRTKGGGRGFSCDFLGMDEAMVISSAMHGALLPTMSAMPNPQILYAGSAVDQQVHEHGVVFARLRERGLAGDDPSLAYFEWSVDAVDETGLPLAPEQLDEDVAGDVDAWAQANPALGIRISPEHVANEYRALDARTFAVERLGVGDWPTTDDAGSQVISVDQWDDLVDVESTLVDPVCFAFDVSPDRSAASISVGGLRPDGLAHVETVKSARGTAWVVARLLELQAEHSPVAVVCDAAGPAASLVHKLEAAGVVVTAVSAQEYVRACGMLFDLVEQAQLRHLGTRELRAALKGAAKRSLGEAWAWSRKSSSVDITPLVSGTLALWGADVTVAPAPSSWRPL